MLSAILKERTKDAHQSLEAIVVREIKAIRDQEQYVRLLYKFYGFHFPVEKLQDRFLNNTTVPDYSSRRKASLIIKDLTNLGAAVPAITASKLPVVDSLATALGSFYVLEGSTQGGSIVAGMLIKYAGMTTENTHFFNAYGEGQPGMWQSFRQKLDSYPADEEFNSSAARAAEETFRLFKEWILE